MSDFKVCTKCGDKLTLNCFCKDKSKKGGLRSSCRSCKVQTDREYTEKSRGKVLLTRCRYRESHRAELAYKERMRVKNFSDDERVEYNRKRLVYSKKNFKERQEIYAIDFANRKARQLGVEGKLNVKQWRDLKRKYGYMCLCCKRQEPEISLTIDHVIPLSKGGLNIIGNIQPLCGYCNKSKGSKIEEYGVIKSKVEENA